MLTVHNLALQPIRVGVDDIRMVTHEAYEGYACALCQTDRKTGRCRDRSDQTDIHEAAPGRRGVLAFVGRPDLKVALLIERIEPVSTMKDGRNYFLARARVVDSVQDWWRPGLGGTARIEAGDRTLLWVLSHRTVRFIQKALWL